ERAGPVGISGQRRPSRSPRSQRSRSADVDCLKKYTERRIEGRRHTEVTDTSKLDTSRWIPLAKNISRSQTSFKKTAQVLKDEDKRRYENNHPSSSLKNNEPIKSQQTSSSSSSTKVSQEEENRKKNVSNEKEGEEKSKWIPQINSVRFRGDTSTFAKFTNSYEITKNAATRWITFAKNPSPFPTPRMNSDKKIQMEENPEKNEESSQKRRGGGGGGVEDNKTEATKWTPLRKFASPVPAERNSENEKEPGINSPEVIPNRSKNNDPTDAIDKANKLSQRMRELYDFKTENEWPKRLRSRQFEETWISKSSSEEERYPSRGRRNSQDMEFNDRLSKTKDTRSQMHRTNDESQVFHSDTDEKSKKMIDRHSNSEDLGLRGTAEKLRIQNRRTHSDDYDEKCRRRSSSYRSNSREDAGLLPRGAGGGEREQRINNDNKRNSNASGRLEESRGSYTEIELPVKRNSRTSDASYASVGNPTGKRGSLECHSTQRILDMPPRRAFSQGEGRPSTPVPPIEMNTDHAVAVRLISECQKRDSTRYKVYLT
ncbi:hypothetical protein M0802_001163, partial [Mischocyttarus mexicanus]